MPKQRDYSAYKGLWISTAINGEVIASAHTLDMLIDVTERGPIKRYEVMEVK